MNGITLKTIYDLLGEKFYVPYYQRGYRWADSQVKQLLDDVWEFANKDKDEKEFYCLQPIVVRKKKDESWELIDGQQRLTTIYLILKFIENKLLKGDTLKSDYGRDIFEIEYEVREHSKEFLENIMVENTNSVDAYQNIDFYFIDKAFRNIVCYFDPPKKFNRSDLDDFLKVLLNRVKIIWYEVGENADAVEIFTRLNIGKIPLTNAELIRALFLHKIIENGQVPTPKQLQIASEWDEIENTLQKDEFWYFIFNPSKKSLFQRKYDTRIEYIFDLMKERPKDEEDYYTFYEFYKELQEKDIETLWKEIKRYFYTFKEWYEDNEFYHLIGYLIAVGKNIAQIKEDYDQKTKTEFRKFLKDEIKKTISDETTIDGIVDQIKDMQYGDNDVKRVLLLFNILILLNNKGASIKFPFDRYKKEKWDIEHVFSQTDIELKGITLKKFVRLILEFWSGAKIEEDKDKLDENDIEDLKKNLEESDEKKKKLFDKLVEVFNKNKNAKELFDEIKNDLIEVFHEANIEDRDNISNLVLLDSATNRAYKNAFFPIKRAIILEKKIKNGNFVPIGTQNVFLKAYSKRFDNIMYWTQKDAEDYLDAIIETFKEFFNKGGGKSE